MKTGYAVRICGDGKVKVEKVPNKSLNEEVSVTTVATMLDCHEIELVCIDAEKLPIAERFLCVVNDFADEKHHNFNELANELCGFDRSVIYGDALLFPYVRGESEDEEVSLSMSLEVADTVAQVCKICRYALDNGIFETLIRKDAEE